MVRTPQRETAMMISTKAIVGLAAAMGATGAAGTAIAEKFIEGDVPPSAAVLIVSVVVTIALLGTCFGFVKWVLRNQGIYEPLTKLLTERLQQDARTDETLRHLVDEVERLRKIVEDNHQNGSA